MANLYKISLIFILAVIAACTDYGDVVDEKYEELIASQQVVDTLTCDLKTEGLVVSTADGGNRKCESGEWIPVADDNGISSSSKKQSSSSSVAKSSSSIDSSTERPISSSAKSSPVGSSETAKSSSSSSAPKSSSSSIEQVSSSSDVVESSSSVVSVLYQCENGTYVVNEEECSKRTISSSSVQPSSSSAEPSDRSDYDAVKHLLKDYRDGKVYKTVTIGEQIWMAENLDYDYNEGSAKSYCYDNAADSCEKYGRLYLWSAAMDSAAVFSTAGKGCGYGTTCKAMMDPTNIRGVCPDGWHIPRDEEWVDLFVSVGGMDVAGKMLKSSVGWSDDGNGLDEYGFSVLPSGYHDNLVNFGGAASGGLAHFWSTSEHDAYGSYVRIFRVDEDDVLRGGGGKGFGFSIRCIKNSGTSENVPTYNSTSKYDAKANTLVDYRDGHSYKTVAIGDQVWMAENLNYMYEGQSYRSSCYNDSVAYCRKYGQLYSFYTAMDYEVLFDSAGRTLIGGKSAPKIIRGVCPEHWHLPSQNEWKTLFTNVGGDDVAGFMLKGKSGWEVGFGGVNNETNSGVDYYGFNILPAGFLNSSSKYDVVNMGAFYWTSSLYYFALFNGDYKANISSANAAGTGYSTTSGMSVRCVWDTVVTNEVVLPPRLSQFFLNPNIEYGEMTDLRDGQTYKTVSIGAQTWMAENLNYDYNVGSAMSYCYDDKTSMCSLNGRLYTWAAAMDSASLFGVTGRSCLFGSTDCSNQIWARGVCPEGWHVPNYAEWTELLQFAGTADGNGNYSVVKLKSQSRWNNDGNGTDDYGFSAYPIGTRNAGSISGSMYSERNERANFWISDTKISASSKIGNHSIGMYYSSDKASNWDGLGTGAVRCVKGAEKPSWRYLNSDVSYGTLTDSRDNQVYKTVDIGDQTWMAENLNYEYNIGTAKSFCYKNNDENCLKYGRLYNWSAAMDSAAKFSSVGEGCGYEVTCTIQGVARGVCPEGWHLPSEYEWNTLIYAVGDDASTNAGYALKSSSGWTQSGYGSNAYGFTALPVGIYATWNSEPFIYMDDETDFWTSNEKNEKYAYSRQLRHSRRDVATGEAYGIKTDGYSVRCVKNSI